MTDILDKEWRVLYDAHRWSWSDAIGIETVEPPGTSPEHVCFLTRGWDNIEGAKHICDLHNDWIEKQRELAS